jgi:hypothetical protein
LVTWPIAGSDDLAIYHRHFPKEANLASLLVLGAILVAGLIAMVVRPNYAGLSLLAAIPFFWSAYRFHVVSHIGLTEVVLTLASKRLALTEHYGKPGLLRSRNSFLCERSQIKSMTWTAAGLFIERTGISARSTVLPGRFFREQKAIDAMCEWASAHVIEIAGVPPLPGGYVRPEGA